MARSASAIQAEITIAEAQLAAIYASKSYGINGRSKTTQDLKQVTDRLDQLYLQLGRANGTSPMFVRGVVRGLR